MNVTFLAFEWWPQGCLLELLSLQLQFESYGLHSVHGLNLCLTAATNLVLDRGEPSCQMNNGSSTNKQVVKVK